MNMLDLIKATVICGVSAFLIWPATAACRFYITLSKAPFLDGNFTVFGKVTQGLDVARRIFWLPVRNDPEYPEGDRPVKPAVIRKVTIRTSEDGHAESPP